MASARAPAGTALVWFRRDLRLTDNPALAAAARSGLAVVPVFILETEPPVRAPGAASLWWLDKSLTTLAAALTAKGSRLILRRGDPRDLLPALASDTGARLLTWNADWQPAMRERDAGLAADLRSATLDVQTFNAGLLLEPEAIRTKTGGAYGVFTPFWRAARSQVGHPKLEPAPKTLAAPKAWPASEQLAAWGLHPAKPDWSQGFGDWTPGEAGAGAALERLLDERLGDYSRARDRPAEGGSSQLSPHLAWGEIGPRQIYCAVESRAAPHPELASQADKFLSELAWREFNYGILNARGDLATRNVKRAFDAMAWRAAPLDLQAWKRGRTGYPVVDAGMRQLWRVGWMHNRVRLITASFLVKHLLIDWREGERWFWDTLVDADPANNPANWQWIAGSGADASPFFRIFNPVIQGEKFDPQGAYVRRWVPELARLPDRYIHAPWTAPGDVLKAAGVTLGRTYPKPIVDHALARVRALDALKAVRGPAAEEDEA